MKIIWSKDAINSYDKILEFLLFIWNEEVQDDFKKLVKDIKFKLLENPLLGKPFKNNIREIVIHKNVNLFYKYDEMNQTIEFRVFKDNRQNPEDYLKKFL